MLARARSHGVTWPRNERQPARAHCVRTTHKPAPRHARLSGPRPPIYTEQSDNSSVCPAACSGSKVRQDRGVCAGARSYSPCRLLSPSWVLRACHQKAGTGELQSSRLGATKRVLCVLGCVPAEREMDLPFEPAIPGQFSLLWALVSGLIPDTWESDFYERQLDARSRLLLSQASRGCQAWVWGAADRATVTLRANGATSAAACAMHQARAEQRLAQRAGRSNAVVLQMSSFSDTALHALLSIAPAASSAVTELAVQLAEPRWRENEHAVIHTPWLSQLPAVFSNLRTLRMNCVRGCLPTPSSLPHLRELHLAPDPCGELHNVAPTAMCSRADMCDSVAPYLQQIHTLELRGFVRWSRMLTTASHTLRVLETDMYLTDDLVRLVCKQTPKLERLICSRSDINISSDHSQAEWSVREVGCWYNAEKLAKLPRSPGDVLRLSPSKDQDQVSVYFTIHNMEVRKLSTQGLP